MVPNGVRVRIHQKKYVWKGRKLYRQNSKDVLIVDADGDEDNEKPLLFRNVVNSDNNLKFLYLDHMRLSSELFESLSLSFPSLETLHLLRCFGFEEIQLSSGSIKHLRMEGIVDGPVKKAVTDAPSLVLFEYEGDFPNNLYFKATTTAGWKSKIVMQCFVKFDYDASPWCLKIYDILQALNEAEISIEICQDLGWVHGDEEVESDVSYDDFFYGPIEVERLHLNLMGHSMTSSSDIL